MMDRFPFFCGTFSTSYINECYERLFGGLAGLDWAGLGWLAGWLVGWLVGED